MKPGTGYLRSVTKYRITGVRHKHHISLVHDGRSDMGQSLLGAQQGTNLCFRVQLHPIPGLIPSAGRLQHLPSVTDGIHIVGRLRGGSAQCLHNMRRGRYVRRSYAEIDDLSPLQSFSFLISASFEKIPSPKRSILFANFI